MLCHRCGARLALGTAVCPECGARQRRQAGAMRCAYCHGRIVVGMAMCPHCGRDPRPAGPRWGLWLGGALLVILVGLWALGKLPVERLWQEVAETRSRLAGLAQIPELPTLTPGLPPTLPPTPTATPRPTQTPTATPTRTPTRTLTPAPTADEARFYTVQPGDSLAGIGAKLGIAWELIAATNGINERTVLQVGQRLRLPAPTPAPSPTATRTPLVTATPAATATATPAPAATAVATQAPATTAATAAVPTPASPTAMPTAVPATATPTQVTAAGVTRYRVQAGDTLGSIGARFGVPWEAIAAANNITGATMLQLGQELIIPRTDAPIPPTATSRPAATATPVPPTPSPAPSLPTPILSDPADQASYFGGEAAVILSWQRGRGLAGRRTISRHGALDRAWDIPGARPEHPGHQRAGPAVALAESRSADAAIHLVCDGRPNHYRREGRRTGHPPQPGQPAPNSLLELTECPTIWPSPCHKWQMIICLCAPSTCRTSPIWRANS